MQKCFSYMSWWVYRIYWHLYRRNIDLNTENAFRILFNPRSIRLEGKTIFNCVERVVIVREWLVAEYRNEGTLWTLTIAEFDNTNWWNWTLHTLNLSVCRDQFNKNNFTIVQWTFRNNCQLRIQGRYYQLRWKPVETPLKL